MGEPGLPGAPELVRNGHSQPDRLAPSSGAKVTLHSVSAGICLLGWKCRVRPGLEEACQARDPSPRHTLFQA